MKTFSEWLEKHQDQNNIISDKQFIDKLLQNLSNIPMLRVNLLAANHDPALHLEISKDIEKALFQYTEKQTEKQLPLDPNDREVMYFVRDFLAHKYGENQQQAFRQYH